MTTRHPTAAAARIGRLTGRGRDDDRGGGLPLADLFEPILRTLHERGDATRETLIDAARSGFVGQKTSRLQYMYGLENPWSALITDALEQLSSRELVTAHSSGRYTVGPKFLLGKSLIVIPAGGAQQAVRVTVHTDEQRAARAGETASMYITELASELDVHRGGIRPLDLKRVEELAASMEAFGFRTEAPFAVLKDQHGRVLDGRHRIAAAEKLGIEWDNALHVHEVKVENDREALALTWTANVGQASWTSGDLTRITRALGGQAPAVVLSTTVQVRNALLDRAGRVTDREVARLVGCDHKTVGVRRAELEADGSIQPYDPEAEKQALIRTEIERDSDMTDYAISKRLSVSQNTVKAVRKSVNLGRAAGALLQRGEIPQTEVPELISEPPPVPVPKPPTKGERIDAELLTDPDRPDKEIAQRLGVDRGSVWRRREKLKGKDPYRDAMERPAPPKPAPVPTEPAAPPGSLTLDWTEDARVLAEQSCAWMTDPNVLLEWGNRLVSTAKRRGAS